MKNKVIDIFERVRAQFGSYLSYYEERNQLIFGLLMTLYWCLILISLAIGSCFLLAAPISLIATAPIYGLLHLFIKDKKVLKRIGAWIFMICLIPASVLAIMIMFGS